MRAALFAIIVVWLAVDPSRAVADVRVDPDRRNTSLQIEATRDIRPSSRDERARQTIAVADRRRKVIRITRTCRVDKEVGNYGCRTYRPADPEGDPRELTEGEILQAVREIGLPRLDVTIQPGQATLVNADTNFYTDPEAFARSIDLLGFDVDLQASPVRYTWVHGDGTRHATAKPGRQYPHLDVTHRYREPAEVVRPRVDVTYRVRYRVDGGAWATLGQTLTASGPTTDLAVNEAAPVLTAP